MRTNWEEFEYLNKLWDIVDGLNIDHFADEKEYWELRGRIIARRGEILKTEFNKTLATLKSLDRGLDWNESLSN